MPRGKVKLSQNILNHRDHRLSVHFNHVSLHCKSILSTLREHLISWHVLRNVRHFKMGVGVQVQFSDTQIQITYFLCTLTSVHICCCKWMGVVKKGTLWCMWLFSQVLRFIWSPMQWSLKGQVNLISTPPAAVTNLLTWESCQYLRPLETYQHSVRWFYQHFGGTEVQCLKWLKCMV